MVKNCHLGFFFHKSVVFVILKNTAVVNKIQKLNNLQYINLHQRCPVDTKRVLKYGLGVICFSVLYCLPTFFEYIVDDCTEEEDMGHTTILYKSIFWTALRENLAYIVVYKLVVDFIVRYSIPIFVLFITNFRYIHILGLYKWFYSNFIQEKGHLATSI